jgi:hypothetical protein
MKKLVSSRISYTSLKHFCPLFTFNCFLGIEKPTCIKHYISIFILIALFFTGMRPINAQPNCQDFESFPTTPVGAAGTINLAGTGWVMYNSVGAAVTLAPRIKIQLGNTPILGNINIGNTTKVITASDISGSTHLMNNVDYNGDWTLKDSCFCFSLKLMSDGSPTNLGSFTHGINIFKGLNLGLGFSNALNIFKRFQFVLNAGNSYSEATPWKRICLPVHKINAGDPLPSNSFGSWVAAAPTTNADWNSVITNVTAVGFMVDVTNANVSEVIGLDSICLGCDSPPINVGKDSFCCPGTNLVSNGGFGGAGTFTSQYTQQTVIGLSSIVPGQYGIINQAQAATVSPFTWLVQDHGTCSGVGNFLAINGRTGQTGTPATIWQQTITVMPDSQYRFCAYVKNLPQCGFDVKPIIRVNINTFLYLAPTVISVPATPLCNWQMISFNFTGPLTGTANIEIWLDETGLGDGNDLAIDDISVTKLAPNATNLAQFQISTQDNIPNDNFYSITATPDFPLPVGCRYGWLVCETDPADFTICYTFMVGGTLAPGFGTNWNYTSTNFPGFCCINNGGAIGNFEFKKSYRISLVIDCECKKLMQWTTIINVQGRQAKATTSRPTNFKLSDADIRNALTGKASQK